MKNMVRWILAIAAVAVLIGALAWLVISCRTNDGGRQVYTVTINGVSYSAASGETGLVLPAEGEVVFGVSGTGSYTVRIVSNIRDTDGGLLINHYIIDGGAYMFSADDYTSDFLIELHEGYFVMECTPGCYGLETLLCRKWNASSVTFDEPVTEEYLYKMIITSAEGEEIVVLLVQEES